jgi:hypothetical protein
VLATDPSSSCLQDLTYDEKIVGGALNMLK